MASDVNFSQCFTTAVVLDVLRTFVEMTVMALTGAPTSAAVVDGLIARAKGDGCVTVRDLGQWLRTHVYGWPGVVERLDAAATWEC